MAIVSTMSRVNANSPLLVGCLEEEIDDEMVTVGVLVLVSVTVMIPFTEGSLSVGVGSAVTVAGPVKWQ